MGERFAQIRLRGTLFMLAVDRVFFLFDVLELSRARASASGVSVHKHVLIFGYLDADGKIRTRVIREMLSVCVPQLVLQLHQDGVTFDGVDLLGRVALGPGIQHQRCQKGGLEEGTGGSVLTEAGPVTGIVVGDGSIGEESGVGLGTVKALVGDKLWSGPRRSGKNPISCGMR